MWLLCGVNGSCTEFSPLSMLVGGAWGNASFYWNGSSVFETSVSQLAGGRNASFKAMPVCLWPPFVFIVYNGSYENNVVNCSSDICYYSMCWNASEYHLAVVTRMPCFVPLPVQVTLFTNCLSLASGLMGALGCMLVIVCVLCVWHMC